jgi:hypothetical protein
VHRLVGEQPEDGGADIAAGGPAAAAVAVPPRAELRAARAETGREPGAELGELGAAAELGATAEAGARTAVAVRVVTSLEASELGMGMHEVSSRMTYRMTLTIYR